MENSLKGLMLAAGIIITCIIISLGFYIAREARDTASEGTGQINQLQAEFTDASKTMYDGTEVSGSEVLNVIGNSVMRQWEFLYRRIKIKRTTIIILTWIRGNWEKR